VNEANLAADELHRNISFKTKMMKKLNPFNKNSSGKTQIFVQVNNTEEGYYYEWEVDKFENRLFMLREILEEYFDDGKLPHL
jgi:hypothetical protein